MKEIYVVEDDNGIRELLEFLLVSNEYTVQSFATAEAFRKNIRTAKPDLILMDVMLPDGNGLDMCKGLSQEENTSKIPVILMSAHANIKNLQNTCARDFIAKPFDIDDLLYRMGRLLA